MPQLVGLQADGVHLGPRAARHAVLDLLAYYRPVANDGVGVKLDDEVGGTRAQQLRGRDGGGGLYQEIEERRADGCSCETSAPTSASQHTKIPESPPCPPTRRSQALDQNTSPATTKSPGPKRRPPSLLTRTLYLTPLHPRVFVSRGCPHARSGHRRTHSQTPDTRGSHLDQVPMPARLPVRPRPLDQASPRLRRCPHRRPRPRCDPAPPLVGYWPRPPRADP